MGAARTWSGRAARAISTCSSLLSRRRGWSSLGTSEKRTRESYGPVRDQDSMQLAKRVESDNGSGWSRRIGSCTSATRAARGPERAAETGAGRGAQTLAPQPPATRRRVGANYGVAARRPRPSWVDERHDAPLPPACVRIAGACCGRRVWPRRFRKSCRSRGGRARISGGDWRLPGVRPTRARPASAAELRCARGRRGPTRPPGGRVGSHPQQAARPVVRQGGHAPAATLGLRFSRSGLLHAVDRAARQAQATYARTCSNSSGTAPS